MTDNTVQAQANENTLYDKFVVFLTSLFVGGVAWAALLGLVAITRYGAGYLNLSLPNNYYLELALLNLPWFFGVLVGLVNYGKVLELEG